MYKAGPESDRAEVRRYLMDLLARREYSQTELANKLRRRFGAHPDVAGLLEEAADRGWQDDQRYAGGLVRSRIERGHGPQRIRQELRHKGLDGGVVDALLEQSDTDWYALALQVKLRKFGDALPVDARERARMMRYLAYRGFDGDMIRHALSTDLFD